MSGLLITICARRGSKGVKNKNIRKLNGKPLIYYTIKQASKWNKAKNVVVSTDSERIASIAEKYGAEVPFIRPAKLATDSAGKVPVIRHTLIHSERQYDKVFNEVMDLDVTSPVRKVNDLEKAYRLFLKEAPKTLFSIVKARKNPYFNMVEEKADGRLKLSKEGDFNTRQSAPTVYEMNASIYIYNRDYLLNKDNNSAISDDSVGYLMDEHSAIDIDSEIDFKYIEFLIREGIIEL